MRLPLVLALAALLAACGASPARSSPPAPAASGALSSNSSAGEPAPARASGAASAQPSASGTTQPDAEGIAIGTPVLLHVGDRNLPAVLVTNTSDQARSFTLSASWKQGDVTITGQGAVFDLGPRGVRAVNLAVDSAIPSAASPADTHVEKVLPLDQHLLDVAGKIKFGNATVRRGPLAAIDVPVTNTDSVPHSLSLGAALLNKGQLVGTGSGALPNIGPQLTLPASLTVAGDDAGYDSILTYVTSINS